MFFPEGRNSRRIQVYDGLYYFELFSHNVSWFVVLDL